MTLTDMRADETEDFTAGYGDVDAPDGVNCAGVGFVEPGYGDRGCVRGLERHRERGLCGCLGHFRRP